MIKLLLVATFLTVLSTTLGQVRTQLTIILTLQCGWCVAGRLVPGPLLPDVHHGRRHDLAPRRQGVRQDRLLRRAPLHQVGGKDPQFEYR